MKVQETNFERAQPNFYFDKGKDILELNKVDQVWELNLTTINIMYVANKNCQAKYTNIEIR